MLIDICLIFYYLSLNPWVYKVRFVGKRKIIDIDLKLSDYAETDRWERGWGEDGMGEGGNMGEKQDLRYLRTNRMLCQAFTELLSKKKFEAITINELCEKAFIRRATFYTHFLDKYDFFAYFLKQIRQDFVSNWDRGSREENLNAFMIHMFRELIHYLSDNMNLVQNILNSNAFPILLDTLSEEIKTSFMNELKRSQKSKLPQTVEPEVAASYYAGGIIQLLRYWISSREDLPEDELLRQYSVLVGNLVEPQ